MTYPRRNDMPLGSMDDWYRRYPEDAPKQKSKGHPDQPAADTDTPPDADPAPVTGGWHNPYLTD